MLIVKPVGEKIRKEVPADYNSLQLMDKLYVERSQLALYYPR